MKRKIIAVFLTLSVAIGVFASCAKTAPADGGNSTVVKEDDPWFDTVRLTLDADIELKEDEFVEDVDFYDAGTDLGVIYNIREEASWAMRSAVGRFSSDGTVSDIKEIDLSNVPGREKFTRIELFKAFSNEGVTKAVFYGYTGGTLQYITCELDPSTGKTSDHKVLEISGSDLYPNDAFIVCDHTVIMYLNDAGAFFEVYNGEKFIKAVHFPLSMGNVFFVENLTYDEKNNAISFVYGGESGSGKALLDLETYKIREKEDGSSENDGSFASSDDGVSMTLEGDVTRFDPALGKFQRLDQESGDFEDLFDINSFNSDMADLLNRESIKILSYTDDSAVIISRPYRKFFSVYTAEEWRDTVVYFLKKAEKNPNAGKKIIDLTTTDWQLLTSPLLSDGIESFNRTNSDSFVKLRLLDPRSFGDGTEDTSSKFIEGSDMIYTSVGLSVKTSGQLIDLYELMSPELKADLLQNLLKAYEIDGKLYDLPVNIGLEGILTEKDVAEGHKGFTFDSYVEYVKGECNGKDPFASTFDFRYRTSFINRCIDINGLIKDGKIDFDTEDFRWVAEYAKENLIDMPERDGFFSVGMGDEDYDLFINDKNKYFSMNDYNAYLLVNGLSPDPYVLLGAPASVEHGPRFLSEASLSVVSSTDVRSECGAFVEHVFGKENQSGAVYSIPVNHSALVPAIDSFASYIDNVCDKAKEIFGYDDRRLNELEICRSTPEKRDTFIAFLENAEFSAGSSDIMLQRVMSEEIQPYFAGDRSIDDVIKYMNDRAQKMIDERK